MTNITLHDASTAKVLMMCSLHQGFQYELSDTQVNVVSVDSIVDYSKLPVFLSIFGSRSPHTPTEDYQILSDSFLELLNALLCGGEVPGLFSLEELVKEQPHLEQDMTRDELYTGNANIHDYFVYRCDTLNHACTLL